MTTYTPTRKRYYELHKEEIKKKRKAKYQKNIETEKQEALERHNENKERNNEKSLRYYHLHKPELNKKRTETRRKGNP
jgi:hypothetical protein